MKFFNIEAEQAILGTIILNNIYLRKVEDVLMSQYFALPEHQKIYKRVSEGINAGENSNQIGLKQFFDYELENIGGSQYLSELLLAASNVSEIRNYAFLVKENFLKRQLVDLAERIPEMLSTSNVVNVCDELSFQISKMDNEIKEVPILSTQDMAEALENNWKNNIDSRNITTGVKKLETLMNGGLYSKKLYILGAAAGVGKTSFAQQIIKNALEKEIGCLFFSMEMERENVLTRFLGSIAQINPFRIAINKFHSHEKELFAKATEKWKAISANFFMTDKGSINVSQMKAVLKRVQRKNRIGLVVVDYIQIMPTRDAKNVNESTLIKENVTALKEMAKECDVAVLALSQIIKEDVSSKPSMKSLKGSGGIAEGADFIALMWADGESDKIKPLKISVVKNRNGSLGEVSVDYDGEFGTFRENNNF